MSAWSKHALTRFNYSALRATSTLFSRSPTSFPANRFIVPIAITCSSEPDSRSTSRRSVSKKRALFRKHADHGYSFTDCTSFVLMQELKIRDALTSDHHFVEAGFRVLLG